jgi:uncharacterized membrane protein
VDSGPADAERSSGGRRWSTGRVEAFSDGVFAIAVTLLVLEIKIDPADFDDLWGALGEKWPSYLAYVTSFLTVGAVWIAHHNLFSRLRFVDPALMRINMGLLLFAAFLPFPTGVLADALNKSADTERAAVALYGATALVIEILLAVASRYADRHPELTQADPEVPPQRPARRRGLPAVLYGAAIVVGIVLVPKVAAVGYLVLAARAAFLIGGDVRLTHHRG